MRKFIMTMILGPVALFSFLAEGKLVSTCQLQGRIDLKENTEFNCTGQDLNIAANTLIVTHGFALKISTLNNIQMDLTIRAFEEDHSGLSKDAAVIEIEGLSVDGRLDIFNDGIGEGGMSGDVSLKFLSATKEFKKKVILDASEATARISIQNQG